MGAVSEAGISLVEFFLDGVSRAVPVHRQCRSLSCSFRLHRVMQPTPFSAHRHEGLRPTAAIITHGPSKRPLTSKARSFSPTSAQA